LQEDREATEQQWEERERAIAEREQQFEDYKAKVEAFPQELEATVKRGKETGRNIGQYQAKVKADLYAKEVEGQKQSYELQLQSLEETIGDREARIQTLSKQLDAALKQVQDLAVKAIEGSANQNSLQAIKDIAIEQAKNQQRNK
jgi:chaperonin cofactor prefoldin